MFHVKRSRHLRGDERLGGRASRRLQLASDKGARAGRARTLLPTIEGLKAPRPKNEKGWLRLVVLDVATEGRD